MYMEKAKSLGAPSTFSMANFDSFLLLEVAPVGFNYLHGRTAELVNYLSIGLPGKGMGYTQRAAQGFLKKKVKERLSIAAAVGVPTIIIPRNKMSKENTECKLGDIEAASWHEKRQDGSAWRLLDLKINSIGGGQILFKPINLDVKVTQESDAKSGQIQIEARLSDVIATVRYSDWSLVKTILKENLGDINEKRWKDEGGHTDTGLVRGTRRIRYGRLKSFDGDEGDDENENENENLDAGGFEEAQERLQL